MSNKSIILSSKGLQNIIPNACNQDDDFQFVFGDQEIKINTIFAQFISPAVSKLHLSDPTNKILRFNDSNRSYQNVNNLNLTNDMILLVQKLACGEQVDINKEQSYQMRIISILFENEELFRKINRIFPVEINESNFEHYLEDLQFYYNQSQSSHFYLIDDEKLLQLQRKILYSILTNEHLQLQNEDTLFSFIQKIFLNVDEEEEEEDSEEDDNISIISFYETIEFSSLSEEKFIEFFENFNSKRMSKVLWKKLYPCFYINFPHEQKTSRNRMMKNPNQERYLTKSRIFDFDGNSEHSFEGIIHQLTIESGGNVDDNETAKVTSSSTNGNDVLPEFAVDFEDYENYFQTKNEQNSWIKYDFLDSKVKPTHYSIKTRPTGGKGDNHPRNWVIEGSNSDNDDDWKILDARNDITILDNSNVIHTFDIRNELKDDESYRYLRLRQTGPNTQKGDFYFLTLSALEYFGILYSK